jgi:hypothetical protein
MVQLWIGPSPPRGSPEYLYWWDMRLAWARIAGQYSEECYQWQSWIWFWRRLGSWIDSEARAKASRTKTEFVRCRCRKGYGIVLHRQKRKSANDLCRVLILRDRRFNWVHKSYVIAIDASWLTPVPDWGMDPESPHNTGIPTAVVRERRAIARDRKAVRARKNVLRRQWRGITP